MPEAFVNEIVNRMWDLVEGQPDLEVYALLDAARDERVFQWLVSSGFTYSSLFAGKLPRALAKAAPYIVELDRGAKATSDLIEQGFGNSWGIFIKASGDLNELRHHFRKFLKVKNGVDGKSLLFRYYDPRVMRVYLPTCNGEELRTVLDPLHRCYVENDGGSGLIAFSLEFPVIHGEEIRLVKEEFPLPGRAIGM